jgi:transcriptional repressor NrdR
MKCIFCNHKKTDVVNSRKGKGGNDVWRRRKCLSCDEIFTTEEIPAYSSFFVVKRNLTRKRFVYEKLFASILYAISGGKDKDMGADALLARDITTEVIKKLMTFTSKYISSKEIIVDTYKVLHKKDVFFASRYAMYSVHRMRVIEKIMKK